jgi:hypothetical protein
MKNAIFWDIKLCVSGKNICIPYQCFLSHIVLLCSALRLLETAKVALSSPILVTLMMEASDWQIMAVLSRFCSSLK